MVNEYVSIRELRDEGLLETEFSDSRVLVLIRRASAKIDLFTKQFFVPREGDFYINGRGSPFAFLPGFTPMIRVDTVEVLSTRTVPEQRPTCGFDLIKHNNFVGTLSGEGYALREDSRVLELISPGTNLWETEYAIRRGSPPLFPEGSSNVKLTGVFGWLENLHEFSTILASDSNILNDYIDVNDADGFEVGDQIIIRATRPIMRRIWNIDYDLKRLSVDKISRVIPAGTEVVTYGAIPNQIVECAIRLVNRYRLPLIEDGDEEEVNTALNIIREKIDNYEWEADDNSVYGLWNTGLTTWASTGDLIVDRILEEFKPLSFAGYV